MTNIIYVVHDFGIGGLEKCVVDLVNGLDRTKFKPMICCLTRSGAMEEKISYKDLEIFEMRKREGNDLGLPFRLSRLFRQKKVDIVHSANWGTFIESIVAARLAGVPAHVHMEQGMDFDDWVEKGSIKKKLRCYAQLTFSHLVDKVVAVSEEIRLRYIKTVGISPNKTVTIHNSVDADIYKAEPLIRRKKRHDLGVGDDDILIGSVGRLVNIKNYTLLIHAFSEVSKKHQHARLILIGDGSQRSDLELLISNLSLESSVTLLGERTDAREWLNAFDIFVLPSFFEGLSLSLLEAMSVGLPVVASNVGGNPELISDDESGLLFESKNVNQLTYQITLYIEDAELRRRLGSEARSKIEQFFSTQKLVESYSRLYLECLGKKGIKS